MNLNEGKTVVKSNLRIQEDSNKLLIIKKWNITLGFILGGFSVLWTAITGFIFSGFAGNMFDLNAPFPIIAFQMIFIIVPMFFFLIGIALFYAGIAHIFNKTIISVENGLVLIKHGPIPIMPRQRILQENISQIYYREQQISDNNNGDSSNQGYQLSYINREEQSRPLMGRLFFIPVSLPLFERNEAREIERLMEDFMGIEDKEVMNAERGPQKTIAEKISLYEEAMRIEETPKKEIYANHSPYNEGEYPNKVQALLPSPQSLMVEESMEGLFIFKRWKSPVVIFYIIFGVIWNAITWTIAVVVVFSMIQSGNFFMLFMVLFLFPFLGVGIKMVLNSLAIIYNTSTIHVSNSELIITHRPIPVLKNQRISLSNIRNFELITKTRSNKNGTYHFKVLVINTNDGKQIELSNNDMMKYSDEEVEFLEQKIKNYIS